MGCPQAGSTGEGAACLGATQLLTRPFVVPPDVVFGVIPHWGIQIPWGLQRLCLAAPRGWCLGLGERDATGAAIEVIPYIAAICS